jgi:hypothetical protein
MSVTTYVASLFAALVQSHRDVVGLQRLSREAINRKRLRLHSKSRAAGYAGDSGQSGDWMACACGSSLSCPCVERQGYIWRWATVSQRLRPWA